MIHRLFVFFSLALLLLSAVACQPRAISVEEYDFAGTYLGTDRLMADFTLESAAGPVSLSDFSGQYVVLYYGYTFCPDFCPITLSQMASVHQELGDAADQVQVIMITVDPERDTAEKLAEYMAVFDESFIGLSGSEEAIAAAAEPLGVFYEIGEVAEDDSYYLVNHTTRTYLINPDGAGVLTWPHGTETAGIVSDLEFLLSQSDR